MADSIFQEMSDDSTLEAFADQIRGVEELRGMLDEEEVKASSLTQGEAEQALLAKMAKLEAQ